MPQTVFHLSSGPKAVLVVYMAREEIGDYANTDFLYFNQRSSKYLFTWPRGQNHMSIDWMLWLLVPLHFGTSWGTGKIIGGTRFLFVAACSDRPDHVSAPFVRRILRATAVTSSRTRKRLKGAASSF